MSGHCGIMLMPAMIDIFPDDAHLTVVYGGEDQELGKLQAMLRTVQQAAKMVDPFAARTGGVNHAFGEDHNETVLVCLLAPELVTLRSLGMQYNKSEYPEFRPHIALPNWKDLRGVRIPRDVYFTQLSFWNGDDQVNFWLGTGRPVT